MIDRIREYSMCGALAVLMLAGMGAQAARADLAADVNSALSAGTHPQAVQAVGKVALANPDDADKVADLVTSIISESDAADYALEITRACAKASNAGECTKKVVTQFTRSFPGSSAAIVAAVVAGGANPDIVAAALQSVRPGAGRPLARAGPGTVVLSPGVGDNFTQQPFRKDQEFTSGRLGQVFDVPPPETGGDPRTTSTEEPDFDQE